MNEMINYNTKKVDGNLHMIKYIKTSDGLIIQYFYKISSKTSKYKNKQYHGYDVCFPQSLIDYYDNINTLYIYPYKTGYRISPNIPSTLENYYKINIQKNNCINLPQEIKIDNNNTVIYTFNPYIRDINTRRPGVLTMDFINQGEVL